MYLARYVDLNEGRFGKEQLSFEAFARQAGLLKDNVSIKTLQKLIFIKKLLMKLMIDILSINLI